MTEQEKPVVLIAEDERSVAEGYELWLSGEYNIRMAVDGQEALDAVDETVDIVLLDRASVDELFREYHSLMARKGALQSQKTVEELTGSAEYQELLDRIETKRAAVDDDLGDMASEIDFVSAVRELDEEAGGFEDIEVDGVDEFEIEEEDPFETDEGVRSEDEDNAASETTEDDQ